MSLRNHEDVIRCINCNIDILEVYYNKDKLNTKLRVKCPKCNDLTFFYKISNDFGILPCNNYCVENVIEENNLIIVEVK